MASQDNIITSFYSYQDVLGEEQRVREEIYVIVKNLEAKCRELSTLHQRIHFESGLADFGQLVIHSKKLLMEVYPLMSELVSRVPAGQYYKYHDSWKYVMQKLVFAVALMHFLGTKKLLLKEDAAEFLNVENERSDGFHLDLEDYLHGLLSLASELARLAVTSATAGRYDLPMTISKLVSEMNAGFMLMNFKNDALRKRYDALKYDQKKIEEVVFDLAIRGLKPKE
ncbi:Translin [Nesidiocoris tenuis]|uniref:Translin n=1 Tax=Nesidiocoris tenuis TaxID=355587 RepID=A0ABN7AYS5_9HEMI|nr:Translin [Nesidiocoris tenuis]